MENTTTLIIEDNPGDVLLLNEQLKHAGWPTTKNEHKTRLSDAIKSLKNIKPAIVFLDLNLPDSNGLETFLTINAIAPDIPIIILSGINDTDLSVQAVKAGAQDYLVKGEFEEKILLKTILYGIERKKNQLRIEEANMRYTLASKATNDPLWDWDINSNKIDWNDKVRIFGYHDSLNKNESWRMANIHTEDSGLVQRSLKEAIDSGKEQWSCEYRFRCADGTYKYILDRGYILWDRNNKPLRMIGTMQDLTEKILMQKRIDEEKEKSQRAILKAAIDAQEKERDFIGKELHDNINQILTSASIYLGFAEQNNKTQLHEIIKTSREYIKTAIAEIRKLSQALSASEINEIGLVEVIEDLTVSINLLNICKVRFVHSGNLDSIPSDLSLTIFRIVQEQLNNIVKHSQAANATVSIDIEEAKIILHISDDGIGTILNQKNQYKGVGLSNIRSRVLAYNGQIEIKTSPGHGFEIFIELMY